MIKLEIFEILGLKLDKLAIKKDITNNEILKLEEDEKDYFATLGDVFQHSRRHPKLPAGLMMR